MADNDGPEQATGAEMELKELKEYKDNDGMMNRACHVSNAKLHVSYTAMNHVHWQL